MSQIAFDIDTKNMGKMQACGDAGLAMGKMS